MAYSPMPAPAWVWRARLVEIIDADTVVLALDFGFDDFGNRHIRLAGLNAAEHTTPAGIAAIAWVRTWFPAHTAVADWPLVVSINKTPDKFGGRYDGVIYGSDGACLNQALIDSGNAAPWDGKGKKPVPGGV